MIVYFVLQRNIVRTGLWQLIFQPLLQLVALATIALGEQEHLILLMEQLEENVLKDTIVMVLLEMKLHAQEEPIILMKECLLACLVLLDIFAIILL